MRRGVGISHNPESNMKLASGAAPVVELPGGRRRRSGLGTDGAASNNDLDMFEAMRQAAFLAKLREPRPDAPSVPPRPWTWPPSAARGRSACGDQIGSLEAGKRADLDDRAAWTAARQTPMYDPVSHLVYVTRGDDVETTIVNGQVLMRDRVVRTLEAADGA